MSKFNFLKAQSNADRFFKHLEDTVGDKTSWDNLPGFDKDQLMSMYSDVDEQACRDALIRYPYLDELIGELLEFASVINDMHLSKMADLDACIIENIQKSIRQAFSYKLGPIIENSIPYAISYEEKTFRDNQRLQQQINDLGGVM